MQPRRGNGFVASSSGSAAARLRLLFWLAVLLCVLFAPSAAWSVGPTNVSGTISVNTTWTLADSPYVMTGNVFVASGVTLTIEPGVVVQGDSWSRLLTVNGSLSAVGTAGQPITFTSTGDSAPGQWFGISFPAGAGASTLKYVNVRNGGGTGGGASDGMVSISGGTITIEDSTFSKSDVSAVKVFGTGSSVTIRRSKFEGNGFSGSNLHGHGLYAFQARVVVEDSAFWSNASNGLRFDIAAGYSALPSEVTGSSIWDNKAYGVYVVQDAGVEALGPDGHVAGKPGNAVYDNNGGFGFSVFESWNQLFFYRSSLGLDWTGNYFGPVRHISCAVGNQTGHLGYGFSDPTYPNQTFPIERGPVAHTFDIDGSGTWCGNDTALVNPPALQLPDLYFDAPPPIFGGIPLESTFGRDPCQCVESEVAGSYDAATGLPFDHTEKPVNTASGALTESVTDLRLAGPGIPFAWTRSYTSRDTTVGALGLGWTHPFDAKVTVVDQGTGRIEYRSGSGQRTSFTKMTGGSTGPATYRGKGFDGTFTRLGDNSYELVTRDQRLLVFDSAGQLTQIKPRFLPATTLGYASGKLSSITDSAGRAVTLTYSTSDPSLIERVSLPDGRYVQYGYTGGRLTTVLDARGKTWTYGYDGSGRLASIQDPTGRFQLQNVQYDGQGRVTSEQNGLGDTITYAYTTVAPYDLTTVSIPGRGSWVYRHRGYMLLSVSDPLGRTTSYSYDVMARKASVTDGRGNTTRFEYDLRGNLTKEVPPAPFTFTVERTYNLSNDLLTEKDGRGNTTTYEYATGSDPAADYQVGQLKRIVDREAAATSFKYWTTSSSPAPPATNVGLLKSTTNPRLKTTLHDYDATGNLSKVTSPLGLKTTMGYDSSGRLTSRRDPRGNVPEPPAGYLTEWNYNANDQITLVRDARANETTNDYYDNGQLWKITRIDRGGTPRVTTFEYDNTSRLWKTTGPRNGIETRTYWPDDQLKTLETPTGRKTSYDYDSAGQLTTLVEPNGNVIGATPADWTWTYGYDNAGNRTSESHPDAGTREIAYDALDRPQLWTDALDHTSSVEYDANSNVLTRTNGLNKSQTFTYDKLNRLKTATDERSKTTTYAYFLSGELESVTSQLGNKTSYSLDDDGRVASMVDPRGNVTGANPADYTWAYQHDEAGNRTRVTDPLGNHVDYAYDPVDNLTQITDQRGNATLLTYDVLDRLWKVTPPAAGGTGTLDTVYTYDADGNLATRTDPNDHLTSWVFDLDRRLTSRTTPVGTWNYGYDANSNLKTLETPAGSSTQTVGDGTITQGYDRMGRLTSVDYSDSTPDVSRTYDLAGRPQTMLDGLGTVTYTHDNADRLTDIARTGGAAGLNGTLHYDYDDAGNITGRSYPDATAASASFDDDGRISTITSAGLTTTLGYDAAGNLTTTTLPAANGHVETRTFDRAGRLTTVENNKAGTVLSKHTWTLDLAGNPTKAQTTRGVTDTYDAYEYDTRNRLTASCFGVAAAATDCTGAANKISYAYDKVTNRTQETRSGSVGNTGTFDYTYNTADQLTSTTKSGGPTTSYTYNANGDQTSAGARSFSYDLASRLISTAAPNGSPTTVGKTTIGASNSKAPSNTKTANKVTLTQTASVTKLTARLDGNGTGNGSQTIRGLIYADSAGSPAALLASSAQITIPKGQAAAWVDLVFTPAVVLAPGDYWLTLHTGTTSNIIRRFGDTQAGAERSNSDTYSDGGSNPFGTASSGNWAWSLYATYTPLATSSYSYDGDSRRASSTSQGGADLRYIWDPLAQSGIPELLLERTPTGSLVRRYLNGPNGALTYTTSAASFWYHHDQLNTITDVTNASGAAQWRYEYEAYGAQRSATDVSGSAPENRLRFTGQYLDPETTLYHLRARQYDPVTGRLGALDPIENPPASPYSAAYVYVNGRPTVAIDPLGLCPWGACEWAGDKVSEAAGWVEDRANSAASTADALLRNYVDPVLRKVATPIAGFGDAASFGLTNRIREWMGTNDSVDKCSAWYTGGRVAGYTASIVASVGIAGRVAAGLIPGRQRAIEIFNETVVAYHGLGPAMWWWAKVPTAVGIALKPHVVSAARTATVVVTIAWRAFRYPR